MTEIKINVPGKIITGADAGQYIKIIDDRSNTGGYLILTSGSSDFVCGYDNWVNDEDELRRYFHESDWLISWEILP